MSFCFARKLPLGRWKQRMLSLLTEIICKFSSFFRIGKKTSKKYDNAIKFVFLLQKSSTFASRTNREATCHEAASRRNKKVK